MPIINNIWKRELLAYAAFILKKIKLLNISCKIQYFVYRIETCLCLEDQQFKFE